MLEDIEVLLGGRVAEALVLDDISTGASNDIERATDTARKMVTKYGMSDRLGPIVFGSSESNEVFLGRDFGHTRNYSEEVAAEIDEELNAIITGCYDKTREILSSPSTSCTPSRSICSRMRSLDGEQFKALMEGRRCPTLPRPAFLRRCPERPRRRWFPKTRKSPRNLRAAKTFPIDRTKNIPLPSRGMFLYPVFFLPRTPVFFPEMAGKDAELFLYTCAK